MTDLRQAAQQALEALEGWEHCDEWVWPVSALEQAKRNTRESLAALRTALEQQPEPVATVTSETGNPDITMSWWHEPALPVGTKLYTTPPQRPWVGLTDEDWEQIHDRKDTSLDTFEQGAVWAAARLKERNT
tara:strand:+ start:3220 stop:3615 length:396 start_codon:yes stop_codon:yes gene_type:complete